MSQAADLNLLARLERLYGRAFLRRLVTVGEQARHEGETGGEPADEIVARVKLRHGKAVRVMVEGWRPV